MAIIQNSQTDTGMHAKARTAHVLLSVWRGTSYLAVDVREELWLPATKARVRELPRVELANVHNSLLHMPDLRSGEPQGDGDAMSVTRLNRLLSSHPSELRHFHLHASGAEASKERSSVESVTCGARISSALAPHIRAYATPRNKALAQSRIVCAAPASVSAGECKTSQPNFQGSAQT